MLHPCIHVHVPYFLVYISVRTITHRQGHLEETIGLTIENTQDFAKQPTCCLVLLADPLLPNCRQYASDLIGA